MIVFNNRRRNKYTDEHLESIFYNIKSGNRKCHLWDKIDMKSKWFIATKFNLNLKDVVRNLRVLKNENTYDNYDLFFTCNWELKDNSFYPIDKSDLPDGKYMYYIKKNIKAEDFYGKLKDTVLPCFVTSVKEYGLTKNKNGNISCTVDNIIKVSEYITIDIDHIQPDTLEEIKNTLYNRFDFIKMIFRSPSGDGLKMIVHFDDMDGYFDKINTIPYNIISKMWVSLNDQILNYIEEDIGYKIIEQDDSARDINRLCFLSYDPYALYRENTNPFEFEHVSIGKEIFNDKQSLTEYVEYEKEKTITRKLNYSNDIEKEVKRIELLIDGMKEYGIDPYGSHQYETYMKVGFSLIDLFGKKEEYKEDCFDLFRRITLCDSHYGNYKGGGERDIERQFNLKWDNNRQEGVNYGWFIVWMRSKEDEIVEKIMNGL